MHNWKNISHFLYGKGFWYADPISEIEDSSIFEYFACPVKSFLFNGACFVGHLNSIIDINNRISKIVLSMEKEEIKKLLSEVVENLISKYKPLSIILYGSYAYGNPTEDSDIDLFILKKTNKRRVDRFVQVKKIIYNPNNKIPISPLVYNPEELEERIRIGDDFIKEIYKKGTILYEKTSSK